MTTGNTGRGVARGSMRRRPRPNSSKPANPTSTPQRGASSRQMAGLQARQAAVEAIWLVMERGAFLEDALNSVFAAPGRLELDARDRAFAKLLASVVLRRHGELSAVVNSYIEKPLPGSSGRLRQMLLCGAAQLLVLETPPHAAIDLTVEQCKSDRSARRYSGLTNAVLRRVARDGAGRLAALDGVALNIPAALFERWQRQYGESCARDIAAASLVEPALDLTVRNEPARWAEMLGGVVLPTGSIRVPGGGRVEALPGFEEGAWWVQDAAAAISARLIGARAGMTIADLCAAPGGKTAQLAAAGATVTAVDLSAARLERVAANLKRLGLEAALVVADARDWGNAEAFDAVLIDAPCTATGTIRRHPDILHRKDQNVPAALVELQGALLARAATLVRPGGVIVYSTCSLEEEEGPHQIDRFLAAAPGFERVPVTAGEIGGLSAAVLQSGDMRTLPCHAFDAGPCGVGLDGFFASRLRRTA